MEEQPPQKAWYKRIFDGMIIGTVMGLTGTITGIFLSHLWNSTEKYTTTVVAMDQALYEFSTSLNDLNERLLILEPIDESSEGTEGSTQETAGLDKDYEKMSLEELEHELMELTDEMWLRGAEVEAVTANDGWIPPSGSGAGWGGGEGVVGDVEDYTPPLPAPAPAPMPPAIPVEEPRAPPIIEDEDVIIAKPRPVVEQRAPEQRMAPNAIPNYEKRF